MGVVETIVLGTQDRLVERLMTLIDRSLKRIGLGLNEMVPHLQHCSGSAPTVHSDEWFKFPYKTAQLFPKSR